MTQCWRTCRPCDVGMKKNAKGLVENGYKLHIDTADGGNPHRVMTSASTHDSQADWEP